METWVSNTTSFMSVNGTNFSNISSHNQLCIGSYNTVFAIPDILMVAINLPITFYIIVELILRQYLAPPIPGNSSSFSLSEIFLLNIICVYVFFYTGILLTTIRNLGGVTGIREEYLAALHSCSLIGGSSFFVAMSTDLYMAVDHPIAYVAYKTSTKRKMAHICCTFIWMCAFALGIIMVIFKMSSYHPLIMACFCVTVPISFVCCTLALIALHSTWSGKSGKTSKLEKTKQNAIRFIINCLIILIAYYLPTICLFIYISVEQTDRENLPCQALPLLLTIKISELVAPLIFFYTTGKLKAIAKHFWNIFQNGLALT